jgi:hypothetical protein
MFPKMTMTYFQRNKYFQVLGAAHMASSPMRMRTVWTRERRNLTTPCHCHPTSLKCDEIKSKMELESLRVKSTEAVSDSWSSFGTFGGKWKIENIQDDMNLNFAFKMNTNKSLPQTLNETTICTLWQQQEFHSDKILIVWYQKLMSRPTT